MKTESRGGATYNANSYHLKLELPRVCGIDRMPCPLPVKYAYGRKRIRFMLLSDYRLLTLHPQAHGTTSWASLSEPHLQGQRNHGVLAPLKFAEGGHSCK